MKTIITGLFFCLSVFGAQNLSWEEIKSDPYLRANFPSAKISDEMGSKSLDIRAFCLNKDGKTLTTKKPVKVCVKSRHVGRGYKKCVKSEKRKVTRSMTYVRYVCQAPRCHTSKPVTYTYPKTMGVSVYEWHPRAGRGRKVAKKTYTIPACE